MNNKTSQQHVDSNTGTISAIPVKNAMTKNVIAVSKYDNINEAVWLISDNNISGLPVVDKQNRVIGVVSEADILAMSGLRKGHTFRDILRHILGEPLPERKMGDIVGDIMTSPAITTTPDAELSEIAKILDAHRIKRLPVVDGDNRLIGIISRGDIVRVMCSK